MAPPFSNSIPPFVAIKQPMVAAGSKIFFLPRTYSQSFEERKPPFGKGVHGRDDHFIQFVLLKPTMYSRSSPKIKEINRT
jgi:hypothetical protein